MNSANKKILDINKRFSPRIRQSMVALGPILITINLGMAEGYSSILLPQLEEQMEIDPELSSWIASMAALPMALGGILGGILMEKIGRKAVHILTCFPCIVGWLILYYSYTMTMLLVGRFLTGFCVGLLGPPTGVYMSETAEPKFRGFLLAAISFAISMGIFLSHLLGTFMSWQDTALICCTFPIVSVVAMLFVPESPTFLAKVGKTKQAEEAFFWCRGYSEAARDELKELLIRQNALSNQPKQSINESILELNRPEFLKPLTIIIVFFVTVQMAGNNALTFYSVQIIKQMMGNSLDEYLVMLTIDTIRVSSSIFACILCKKLPRRTLATLGGCGTFSSLAVLSGSLFCSRFYEYKELSFISAAALVTYMMFLNIGFVALPWTMMGEVFPLANRGVGSAIGSMVNYIMIFVVVKTAPNMLVTLGTDGTFMVYSIFCFVGTIILICYLPETKDKPLHVIEDHFKSNKIANK